METHAVHEIFYFLFLGRDGGQRRCSKLPLNMIYYLQNPIELSRELNPHPQSFLFNIYLIIIVVVVVVKVVVVIFLVPNSSLSFGIFEQSLFVVTLLPILIS
jgi:hypothetical protein